MKKIFSGLSMAWWVKFCLTLLALIFGFAFTAPTFLGDPATWPRTESGEDGEPGELLNWYHKLAAAVLPENRISLGLDLRGGLHLVLEVDVDASLKENLVRAMQRTQNRAKEQAIDLTSSVSESLEATLTLEDASKAEDVKKIVSEETTLLVFGEAEGNQLVYEPVTERIDERKSQVLQQAINTIRNRIDQFGVAEPSIFRQGDDRIVVQMPGLTDADRARELIGNTARLDFRLVKGQFDVTQLNALLDEARTALEKTTDDVSVPTIAELSAWLRENDKIPAETTVLLQREYKTEKGITELSNSTPYLVDESPKLTGDFIETADAGMSQGRLIPTYVVNLSFNPQGAKIFGDLTTEAYKPENAPNQIAIVLDGNINSAPSVNNGPILTGRAEITMGSAGFDMAASQREAQDLALVLRAGALPAKVNIIEDRQVGPSEGAANIRAGVLSAAVSGIMVIVFMWVVYGTAGIIANVAMVFNGLLILAFLSAFGATLTLPGIAGIVLTMAMAVDGNVVINERIREEIEAGIPQKAAFYRGYSNSFSSLVDAYVTSAVAAVILLIYGNPTVRGFSVTFLAGILSTLFTAYYVTEVIGVWLTEKTRIKRFG